MGHIHLEAGQYDNTVSAFIINPDNGTVLLHKHKLLGLWLQPGGHVELNENPWSALTHELAEETGYDISLLNILQPKFLFDGLVETVHPVPLVSRSHVFPNSVKHFHTDNSYGFLTTDSPTLLLGEGESDVLYWFTYGELEMLSAEEIIPDTRTIALRLLETFGLFESVPAVNFC